jgi:hypothetical protein
MKFVFGYNLRGRMSMPFIGGMILVFILAFILWSLMFPLFNMVGRRVLKRYNKFKPEENVNEESKDV